MADRVVYVYAQGIVEPLDKEYFKNTLRFLPGVTSVGVIRNPVVAPPAPDHLGYQVQFDDRKLNAEDMRKRLLERGFTISAIQEVPAGAVSDKTTKVVSAKDVFSPVSPHGTKEVLFRVAGLVTIHEVRQIRERLEGTPGLFGFFSMVAEAADEPWAGDTGLVDVQFDVSRLDEQTIKEMIERVPGVQVTSWKSLANNLNFPWPL
jgi:hypothetical protein